MIKLFQRKEAPPVARRQYSHEGKPILTREEKSGLVDWKEIIPDEKKYWQQAAESIGAKIIETVPGGSEFDYGSVSLIPGQRVPTNKEVIAIKLPPGTAYDQKNRLLDAFREALDQEDQKKD